MSETGERALELALAKASILQLTKCSELVRKRTEAAVQREAKIGLREVWVLVAAGCEAQVTQKQIAQHLALNQNVMVQLLDKLERSGHVRRMRNSRNRREQFVRLTRKGHSVLHHLFAAQPKLYRTIFAPLEAEQVAVLIKSAQSLIAFETSDGAPVPRARTPKPRRG